MFMFLCVLLTIVYKFVIFMNNSHICSNNCKNTLRKLSINIKFYIFFPVHYKRFPVKVNLVLRLAKISGQ